jgi:hypothetical protein
MPQIGFKPTISAGELPQTYALDRKVTGTGFKIVGLDASDLALESVTDFYEKIKISGYIKAVFTTGDPNFQTQYC